MSDYKIAVLDDRGGVLSFKALGLDVSPAESVEEAKHTLHTLAKEDYAVVYLAEGYAAHMEVELKRYKDVLTPAIILISGKDGSLGIGMANVKRAMECVVGADVLQLPLRREGGAMQAPPPTPVTRWAPYKGGYPYPPASEMEQVEGADHRQ